MSGPPQKVQVFSLGRPRSGVERDRRRYYVKWRVDGRDRTRSFKTRAEADRFRSSLLVAVQAGERFDLASGEPATWFERSGAPTWWSWSHEWLLLKWPQWSGHSRRSGVETLTLLTPLLMREGAPKPPDDLADWLRRVGFQPGTKLDGPAADWLARWSIPLGEIDPLRIEKALHVVCAKADGGATTPYVVRRRRGVFGAVLRAAVRRELLSTNPMDRVEWRAPASTMAIDVATVPAPSDVQAIVESVGSLRDEAARYAALFAAVGMAGMRPSEAIGLLVHDLDLPTRGWGLASLRGAVTSPGARYTDDGAVAQAKGLKQRAVGATREVPLPPVLVRRFRDHLRRFESVEGRVFANGRGLPVTATNYGRVWSRARATRWPKGHRLAAATVYDLRHTAATMMLRAGVPPAEVARRLGHSVDVLMRVYAGVFDDERERSNKLIDKALRGQPD